MPCMVRAMRRDGPPSAFKGLLGGGRGTLNGVEISMKVWSVGEAGQQNRYGGWLVFRAWQVRLMAKASTAAPMGVMPLLEASMWQSLPTFPHPLGETLDPVFRIGDGGTTVSCSLLGASLLRWNRPGDPWYVEVGGVGQQVEHPPHAWSGGWATSVFLVRSGRHLPSSFGHVVPPRCCRGQRRGSWQIRSMRRFSVSTASGVVRVARLCASCVLLFGVLYVLWCLGVALPLFRVSPGFPTNQAVWSLHHLLAYQ
jgi:hypothetical protein